MKLFVIYTRTKAPVWSKARTRGPNGSNHHCLYTSEEECVSSIETHRGGQGKIPSMNGRKWPIFFSVDPAGRKWPMLMLKASDIK